MSGFCKEVMILTHAVWIPYGIRSSYGCCMASDGFRKEVNGVCTNHYDSNGFCWTPKSIVVVEPLYVGFPTLSDMGP